ncbi:MAG TPA: hypothetical protein VNO70_00160, partial [Blastocatellia bacterium]|nr:hypothetical protein [Blastocatellia bacterium]
MFPNSGRRNAQRNLLLILLLFMFAWQFPASATVSNPALAGGDPFTQYEPLPTFDIRRARRPRAQASRVERRNEQKKKALAVSPAARDKVILRWDEEMDLPRHLLSLAAPLTTPSFDDAEAIAKRFVRSNRALFRVADRQLASARVSARATDERGGFTRLALEQRAGGVRVFGAEMVFIIDREGRVLSQSGCFIPDIEGRTRSLSAALSPLDALYRAAAACGAQLSSPVAADFEEIPARERAVFSSPEIDSRSEASLVYYPVTRDEVRLAWQVLLYGAPTRIDSYLVLVDARTGEILLRDSLVHALDAPNGRVFTKENPTVSGDRELVPLSGDPTASPAGWVAENRTEGNNARVSFNPDLEPAGGKMIKANDDGHFD